MATVAVEPVESQAWKLAVERFFFVGLGLFAIAITVIAFVPEFARFAVGKFPIAPDLHVHAAIVEAWFVMFVLQAWLGATGRIALHRKLGPYGIAMGVIAWVSMIFAVIHGLVVHPLPGDWAGYDELLQDAYILFAFIALLLWAFHERSRPDWHKRLMAIATFAALLAPVERIEWLPELGIGYIYASVVWLNLSLIVPLATYDLASLKRLHPATLQGLALILIAQAAMVFAWGTTPWRNFAFAVTHLVRATF